MDEQTQSVEIIEPNLSVDCRNCDIAMEWVPTDIVDHPEDVDAKCRIGYYQCPECQRTTWLITPYNNPGAYGIGEEPLENG